MDELPKEVLIEIFTYLKFTDRCQLTSTCKLFNEIISNSSTLMDKFRLKFNYFNLEVDVIMKRKFRRILIKFVNKSLVKFLECYGDNIWDLKIQRNRIKMKDFRRILTLCLNVKQLNIDIGELICSDKDVTEPLLKLTLDSLTISSCDSNIFEILEISAKNIYLDITRLDSRGKNALINLLKNQKQLKILNLETCEDFIELFQDDSLINVDFQLETFNADHSSIVGLNLEYLKKFLKNQKSLRKIIFGGTHDVNYAIILGDFENVKELNVPAPYDFLHPMPHIKKLAIVMNYLHKNKHNFHDLFPNVNDLSIDSRYRIKFVENFTEPARREGLEIKISENVKTLRLKKFKFQNNCLFDHDVDIKIENLTIYCCDNINLLIEYLKNNRIKLKSLIIEGTKMKKSQRDYLESLTRGDDKKIEKLKIYMPMILNENHNYVCNYTMEDDHDDSAKRMKLE